MKNLLEFIIVIIFGIILFSCEYSHDDFEDPQIYIPQSDYSQHTFLRSDTTYSLSVYLAGVRENNSDIVAKLSIASSEFNAYNATNSNKYTLLPTTAYKIIEEGNAVQWYVFTLEEAEQNAKMHKQDASVQLLKYIDGSTTRIVSDGFDVVIPKGANKGNFTFTVYGSQLESGKEYILPVKLVDASKYRINELKTIAFFGIKLK